MGTLLISTICSILLSTGSLTEPADTTEKYFINGEAVEYFDGSQLVGQTIKSWKTAVASSGKTVLKIHNIITSNGPVSSKRQVLYFLNNTQIPDGKDITNKEDIAEVIVYKNPENPSESVITFITKDFKKSNEDFKKNLEEKIKELNQKLKTQGN